MNNIKIFYSNLSKKQRIVLWVFIQFVIILLLIASLRIFIKDSNHIEIANKDGNITTGISSKNIDKFKKALWGVIQNNIDGEGYDIVKDVVIREGTYKETDNDSGGKAISFIVDIDSLKQTYTVSMGWNEEGANSYSEVVIDCPPQNLMKYPETICYGMSNNTYSLDLYLPYTVESGKNYDYYVAPNIYIDGNEYEKTITIAVSICNPEKFKKEAMEYLESTPIKLKEYTINYEIDDVNAECD